MLGFAFDCSRTLARGVYPDGPGTSLLRNQVPKFKIDVVFESLTIVKAFWADRRAACPKKRGRSSMSPQAGPILRKKIHRGVAELGRKHQDSDFQSWRW